MSVTVYGQRYCRPTSIARVHHTVANWGQNVGPIPTMGCNGVCIEIYIYIYVYTQYIDLGLLSHYINESMCGFV